MAAIQIEVRGAKELAEKLNADEFKKAIGTALMQGAGTALTIVQRYPRQRLGRKQPFKTAKQRGYFFANLKTGKIRVPYRRTGTLGRKWSQKLIRWNEARVGNNTPYAPLVQDREKQSRFHKAGGWKTTDDIAEQESGQVVKEINRGIENYLRSI